MSKIWFATFLLPYVGFAQNASEAISIFDDEQVVSEEASFGDENGEGMAYAEEKTPTLESKKTDQKEPAFCAYCGAELNVSIQKDSTEIASSENQDAHAKSSTMKKRMPTAMGTKPSAYQRRRINRSDRPQVIQRKEVSAVEEKETSDRSPQQDPAVKKSPDPKNKCDSCPCKKCPCKKKPSCSKKESQERKSTSQAFSRGSRSRIKESMSY